MKLSTEQLKELRVLCNDSTAWASVLDELIAIRELKGDQVPVAYLYMGDEMECKHVELAEDTDEGQAKNCLPLFTAPQKPVVCFGDIAIHENLPIVGALVSYKDVVELIEAAGGIVKDGESATITCWSCKKTMTLAQHSSNDGLCPHCNVEIDLEE